MENFFNFGLKIILFLSVIFFVIFTYVCFMWMNRKPPSLKFVAGSAMIALLHTFKIVLLSVFILGIVALVLYFVPSIKIPSL